MAKLTSEAVEKLLALPVEERTALIRSMPKREVRRLLYHWPFWARDNQVWRPSRYTYTAYLAGRGWGKTRVGAQAAIHVARHPELCGGRRGRGGVMAIAGRTANDVNGTMIHGVSGIMACSPPDFRPEHIKSDRMLVWPNGCKALLFSGEEPASFRGPNIGWLWADELAHWSHLAEAWSRAEMMLRHGEHPRVVITTTPLGVQTILEVLFELVDGNPIPAPPGTPEDRTLEGFLLRDTTEVIGGSTYDNAANVAPSWMRDIVKKHEHSATGDQEIRGRVMLGSPNAIWQWSWIRRLDLLPVDEDDEIGIVTLGIDPALTASEHSAEVGLVVVAMSRKGRLFVLADLSGHYTPEGWASAIEYAIETFGVNVLAYEDNAGGDLIEANLRANADPKVYARARKRRCRATRSKAMRAGIVAPLWEAGRVTHIGNPRGLASLEAQMRNFDPSKPERGQPTDRMDALVWALLSLTAGGSDRQAIAALSDRAAWERIMAEVRRRAV